MIEPALRTPPANTDKAVTDSYIKAVNLNRKIITAAQLAQQSLYDMCMGFKEMRDSKLYKELGYSDFGDYCEQETGIKRRQVYTYIQVAEKLPTDFVHSSAQNGIKKLYLLSTLSEPDRTEIAERTDLERTSVRELEQQIKQIKAEKDRIAAERSAIEAEAQSREQMIKSLESAKKSLDDKISRLETEVKELESRPVETAVQYIEKIPENYIAPEAYERDVQAGIDRADELESELLQEKRKAYAEKVKLEQQIEELKNRPIPTAETVAVTDTKPVFKAYLTTAFDAFNRLAEYTKSAANETYTAKVMELINTFTKTMEKQK